MYTTEFNHSKWVQGPLEGQINILYAGRLVSVRAHNPRCKRDHYPPPLLNSMVALVGRKVQTVNLVNVSSVAGSNPAHRANNKKGLCRIGFRTIGS